MPVLWVCFLQEWQQGTLGMASLGYCEQMLLLTVCNLNQEHTVLHKDYHGLPPFHWFSALIILLHSFFLLYHGFLFLSTRAWASHPQPIPITGLPPCQESVGTWAWQSSDLLRCSGTDTVIIFFIILFLVFIKAIITTSLKFALSWHLSVFVHNSLPPVICAVTARA